MVVCGGGASELRCAAFSCDLRAGSHDASAVDSYGSVVPFLVGLGGGLFYGRFFAWLPGLCFNLSLVNIHDLHYWAECPSLRPARERMLSELDGAYPGFRQRWAPQSRLDRARALAFGVPDDGTWAPGASRVGWARGVRAVVQFGVDSALLCPVLGQAMWRLGR